MGSNFKNTKQELNKEKTLLSNLETFTASGFKMLVEATKKSNNLPLGKSRDLYESFPSFHTIVEKQADYVLSMLSVMLKRTNLSGSIKRRDDEEKFEMIVDSNDTLLENAGVILDELSGIKKNPEVNFLTKTLESFNGSWNKIKLQKFGGKTATQVLNKILNQTKNIEKPQLKFKDKVNNDSNAPFEPKIKYKYNMLKPLACIAQISENGVCQFTHPYEFELEKFKPSQKQISSQPPILYKSIEETPLVFVTEPEDVTQMVNDLEKHAEIAVDLEHHSYRTFQGFTCLMQISTRDTDYIIDTLSLRSDLEVLNKVFTNPSVVKVFHGADLDILWLQRDFALYVVNMFDTHQAAKVLNFPKLSLAYLLSHYCNVSAQKQFQLADWRVRPLPQELITYARQDTHYLLFIYDNLRNALLEKANNETNLLESVISESTRICLKTYSKPYYDTDGYLDLYQRSKKLFDNRQKFALQQLYEWRDTTARELDESFAYVLPDHMMLNISEVLPREAQGILACCNPVPVPVRQNLLSLHQIILKAREQPLIKPILEEQRFFKYTSSITSFDNPLQCPHDLNYEGEFRDDLPVLFSGTDKVNLGETNFNSTIYYCSKPIIDVFENSRNALETAKVVSKRAIHITPYHRYKLSKKYSEYVEVKNLCANDKQNVEKVVENTPSSSESNPENRLDKSCDKSLEITQDSKTKKEKTSGDNKIYDVKVTVSKTDKPTLSHSKRRIKDNELNSAKRSKQNSSSEVNDLAFAQKESRDDTKFKGKKKKKKAFGKKKKEFQPFDYSSVDFKKYQSSTIAPTKKVEKKSKSKKKSGKKNFRISI